MDSKLYIDDVCVGLISTCNWFSRCHYCLSASDSTFNEELTLREVKKIKHLFHNHVVSGGEPGLLSSNFWTKFFDIVNYPVQIATNGTFIVNGYHERFKSHVKSIDIHAVHNAHPDNDILPEVIDAFKSNPHWQMNIVVDKKCSSYFGEFLDKYPDITFVLNFVDESLKRYKADYPCSINKDDALVIVDQLKGRKLYAEYSSRIMKAILKNDFGNLNNWTPKNRVVSSERTF